MTRRDLVTLAFWSALAGATASSPLRRACPAGTMVPPYYFPCPHHHRTVLV
jgi:hypothetical protein